MIIPTGWVFDGFPPNSETSAKHWLRDPRGKPVLASWSVICFEFWCGNTRLPDPVDMQQQGWKYIAPLALPSEVAEADFPFMPDPDGYAE
jgi:hypothetical protein